ncbi:MAG: hypothetical protein ACPGXK_04395, partial [Phycisphaerae bacterium]
PMSTLNMPSTESKSTAESFLPPAVAGECCEAPSSSLVLTDASWHDEPVGAYRRGVSSEESCQNARMQMR